MYMSLVFDEEDLINSIYFVNMSYELGVYTIMSFLNRVVSCMKRLAPLELADHTWDNVGLLIESTKISHKNKVMLTIDLTMDVVQECIEQDIHVVVAYHPVIFQPLKRLVMDDHISRIVIRCIENGISVYSPHTSFDACDDGINDWIARGIGAGSRAPIQPTQIIQGQPSSTGMGRILTLNNPVPLSTIRDSMSSLFQVTHVRACISDRQKSSSLIQRIAICAGSGGSLFTSKLVFNNDIDLFITGEMSHHQMLSIMANPSNPSILLFEHTNTERGYLSQVVQPKLQQMLQELTGDGVSVLVSNMDSCPIEYI